MRLTVEPDVVALSPGDVVDLVVRVANDGDESCTPFLAARGVDPADVLLPSEVVAVAPGEVMTAIVRVRAAADATPGDQRVAVAVEDLDGQQRPVSATTLLRVGARPDVAVQVEPVATAGRTSAKATTILRNRSDRRLQIDLESSAEGVDVRFRPSRVTIDPGETLKVRTRIRRSYRSWFTEIRHGAVVTARGIGAPASTTLTFTQRPAIPRLAVRGLAAFMALAVWIAATAVVFQRINAEDTAADGGPTVVAPAPPGPGRTSATGMFVADEPDGVRLPIVIQGTIEGPRDPAGTRVTAERISFGDEGTTTGLTKVVALTPVKLPRGAVLDKVQVTTDERGRFRIASGLVADSFYRVTAVRAGFEVGSFIVSTAQDAPEVTLAFALVPAPGVMEGRVVDTGGAPIGGATVLVTDGTLTYTTTTASEGIEAGTWTIEGVATPSTYQVVVTRLGFASETLIVDVEGGQRLRGVDATLTADLGTLRGTVRAVDPISGLVAGVGGIDITLAGPEARTTRTVTAPVSLRGAFTFPALPYGTYELTFSAPGWSTRVTEVTVDRGDVVLDVSDLVRSTGVVQGVVWQVATGDTTEPTDVSICRYPRLGQREDETTLGRPCGGVNVSVTDDDGNVFATASASTTGFFQIDGVPAGDYTVRLSRAGYVDRIERLTLRAGQVLDLNARDEDTGDVVPIVLELSAALAACLGTVELTVVQRGTLAPVEFGDPTDPPAVIASGSDARGIRFPVADPSDPDRRGYDFRCEDGQPDPQWRRLPGSNVYLVENVPLGQTPLVVDFEGFAPSERTLAVSTTDVAKAVVQVSTQPRDITGTVRIVSDDAGAARDGIRVRLIDKVTGEAVLGKTAEVAVVTSQDGGLTTEAEFTIPRVDVDQEYRLAFDRPVGGFSGVVPVETADFMLPAGGEPFLVADQVLVARTRVSGTVLGFAASDDTVVPEGLDGASLVFTPVGGAALDPVNAGAGGFFSVDLDAGRYDVEVIRPGYDTRMFTSVPLIGTAADPTQLLQPTTTPFAVYALPGDEGQVGLVPSARRVQVDVDLRGAIGAERDAIVELFDGRIGVPGETVETTDPTHESDPTRILVADAEGSGQFVFEDVPAGVYSLRVVPTDGAGAEDVSIGVAHTLQTVIVGPDTAATLPDTAPNTVVVTSQADAMSRITGRVVGFDVFELTLVPLVGATVTPPDGSGPAVVTGADGSFDLVVRSGSYVAGSLGPILIEPAASDGRYVSRSLTGDVVVVGPGPLPGVAGSLFLLYPDEVTDPDTTGPGSDVGLDPASRTVRIGVDLAGVEGVTERALTVRLIPDARTFGSDPVPDPVVLADEDAAAAGTVASDARSTFSAAGILPGTYRVEILAAPGQTRVGFDALSRTSMEGTAAVRGGSGEFFVDIPVDVLESGTTEVVLTADVQARTVVSGTIFGFNTVLEPAVCGENGCVEIAFPVEARASLPGGAGLVDGRLEVGDDGQFSVEVDSRSYADYADGFGIVVTATDHQPRTVRPVLADGTGTLLTGAADPDDRPFLPNEGTDGLGGVIDGELGHVVLIPTPREVTVDLELLGAPGATRDVTVRLSGGTLGGVGTTLGTAVSTATTPVPVTLEVGEPPKKVTLSSSVPIGAYTLEVDGDAADHVTAVRNPGLVVPGDGATSAATGVVEVQALTTLTVNVTGVQVAEVGPGEPESLTLGSASLAGATVTPPADGSATPTSLNSDANGRATFVLKSGVYSVGDLGAIEVTKGEYTAGVIAGADATLVNPVEDVTLELAAADTTFTGEIALKGAAGAVRTGLTVEVCAVEVCTGGPVLPAAGVSATQGNLAASSFGPIGPLAVGVYWFRVTGDDIVTTTVRRVVGPAAGAFETTPIEVDATVTVTGTVVEGATTGDPDRTLDTTLPLEGITVTAVTGVPPGGDTTDITGVDGKFSLTLLSGEDAALSFAKPGFTLDDQTVPVGAGPEQPETFTMVRGAVGIRIEGAISGNVTSVVARTTGVGDVTATLTGGAGSGGAGSERYAFEEGLATDKEWEIEFVVGDSERFVRRYISSTDPIAIELDQYTEIDDVGAITVTIEVGQDPSEPAGQTRSVRVTLTESVPSEFFTIPGGELVETVTVTASGATLNDVMTGDVTFSGLAIRGSSPSIPPNRFTLRVEVLDEVLDDRVDPGTVYRWEQDAEAEAGTAEVVGFELPRTAGSAATVTKPFRFVRAPSEVQDLEAAVAPGSVDLTWDAPAGSGGATALRYDVQQDSVAVGACQNLTLLTCPISGLADGTNYTFTVVARNNAVSDLAASTSRVATTPSVPDAPTGVTASATGGSVTVDWTAPADPEGAPVTGYTITSTPAAVTAEVDAETTSVTFDFGFAASQSYTFSVVATNAVGDGPASEQSSSVTPVDTVAAIDPGDSSTFATFTPLGGLGTTDGGPDGGVYFAFDGVDDALDLGESLLPSNTSYTIIAWVHRTAGTTAAGNILSTLQSPFWVDPGLRARVAGTEVGTDTASFPTGVWQHVAFTFQDGDGSMGTATLFRGGATVDELVDVPADKRYQAGQAYLGAWVNPDGTPRTFWTGRIGLVEVWTGALTADEIRAHFDATKGRYGVS